jgi:hypothetical protein
MESFEQRPFADAEFAANPKQRCPCVLSLDSSGFTQSTPVQQLNDTLQFFREDPHGS